MQVCVQDAVVAAVAALKKSSDSGGGGGCKTGYNHPHRQVQEWFPQMPLGTSWRVLGACCCAWGCMGGGGRWVRDRLRRFLPSAVEFCALQLLDGHLANRHSYMGMIHKLRPRSPPRLIVYLLPVASLVDDALIYVRVRNDNPSERNVQARAHACVGWCVSGGDF